MSSLSETDTQGAVLADMLADKTFLTCITTCQVLVDKISLTCTTICQGIIQGSIISYCIMSTKGVRRKGDCVEQWRKAKEGQEAQRPICAQADAYILAPFGGEKDRACTAPGGGPYSTVQQACKNPGILRSSPSPGLHHGFHLPVMRQFVLPGCVATSLSAHIEYGGEMHGPCPMMCPWLAIPL